MDGKAAMPTLDGNVSALNLETASKCDVPTVRGLCLADIGLQMVCQSRRQLPCIGHIQCTEDLYCLQFSVDDVIYVS